MNYADSDVGSLNTVLPVFSIEEVRPSTAHRGQTVYLTVRSSKALAANPAVTINGVPTDSVIKDSDRAYTCVWKVLPEDPPGNAVIIITGEDPLGNGGVLNDNTSLVILTPGHGLPQRAWPVLIILPLLGILALFNRRKNATRGVYLPLVLLLAAASAFGELPQVSNVRFSQGSDGAGGTKVDIYYDLIAPNGPCTVAVALSKNGGEDGFIYSATAVRGDISRVDTGINHHIVWAIAEDYPNEDIPNARVRVTAEEAFSLVFMTDTHVDMKCSEYNLQSMAEWIIDQEENLNIRYVGHLGDVGDNRGSGNLTAMLQKARSALQPVMDSGIALSVAIGNHDYEPPGSRSADAFNRSDTFGLDLYEGTFEQESEGPCLDPGGTINHYSTQEIYGRPYLFLTLEYYPRDKVLDWADNLVRNQFPEHEVIVSTHAYLNEFGNLSASTYVQSAPGPEYSNSGISMWERYFKYWENLRFILNGHFINTPRQKYLEQTGAYGNVVHSHFFNYQNWGYKFGSLYYVTESGLNQAATVKIFTLYPASNRVVIRNYTPSAGKEIEAANPNTHSLVEMMR
ncbi:MAG: hypothetical protein GXY07_09785 [Candidatus Hydrogenedentes bacterium]|nr:hypothetical protein [Candidatus Hydrogenedentota bacterium]